jgi:iron complex transport system substrate-binding protein
LFPAARENGAGLKTIPNFPGQGIGDFFMKTRIFSGLALLGLVLLAALAVRVEPGKDQVSSEKISELKAPERIISLAPSITEVLFALGLDEEIKGVTDYCNYPPRALTRPKVGSFISGDVERIISMKPDLVIATRDGNSDRIIRLLSELGIRVVTYQPSTLEEVLEQIQVIGRVTGREEKARKIVGECLGKMDLVKNKVHHARMLSVLFVFSREPLIVAGRGTFSDDMIKISRGRNIAGDSRNPYPQFSLEELIARAPEVIVDVSMGSDARAKKAADKYWSNWPEIPAVGDGRIYVLDEDLLTRPGPRLFEGLVLLAEAVHPESFGEGRTP